MPTWHATLCWLALSALGAQGALAADAAPAADDCSYRLSGLPNAPRFEDFRVAAEKLRPVAPRIVSRDAQEFRSELRDAAKAGPNFAGHYKMATWGCGSACNDFAIIDGKTGQVFFDSGLRPIAADHVDMEPDAKPTDSAALRFRHDSRLLVVLGAPREDDARDGIAFFEWTGRALRPLRFVPRAEACARPH
jgi:hypothetical protein